MDFDSFSEAAAGAIGGIFSCSILYPLEVIKNNLQSGAVEGGMVAAAKHVYKKEGAAGFTKGVQVAASCSATEKFLYFYIFRALIKRYEAGSGGEKIGAGANLAVGYLSDWLCRPVVLPLDTLSLQLSLAGGGGLAADPESWTAPELEGYDGWGHDSSRTWRNGERLEAEGVRGFRTKFGPTAFTLNHRFYWHLDRTNQIWLSAEDGCQGRLFGSST